MVGQMWFYLPPQCDALLWSKALQQTDIMWKATSIGEDLSSSEHKMPARAAWHFKQMRYQQFIQQPIP